MHNPSFELIAPRVMLIWRAHGAASRGSSDSSIKIISYFYSILLK